jgi:hypothetical protein
MTEESDERIRYRHKFGDTLSLQDLMQRWRCNFKFINELAFDKKITPYLDGRAALVCKLDGKRTFLFSSLPTDDQISCIVENVAACQRYEILPDNVYFYWPEILSFEEAHPGICKQPVTTETVTDTGGLADETLEDAGADNPALTPREGGYWERDNFAIKLVNERRELLKMRRGEIKAELQKASDLFKDGRFTDWWNSQKIFPKGKGGRTKGSRNRNKNG